MKQADNWLCERAGDKDELTFGVVRTPENDYTIVERSLLANLGKTFKWPLRGANLSIEGVLCSSINSGNYTSS